MDGLVHHQFVPPEESVTRHFYVRSTCEADVTANDRLCFPNRSCSFIVPVFLAVCYIRGAVKKFPELLYIDGLVHHQFIPPGQSVTGHLYV
jgi:hypothetical protein